MSAHVTATRQDSVDDIEHAVEENTYANDDLDSIFGSVPNSPILSATDDSRSRTGGDTQIQDEPSLRRRRPEGDNGNQEISDVPRLKERHETEGYRDGVTRGKAETVQQGFDEGYTLGAVLGLRIGKVVGLLEGLAGAVRGTEGEEGKRMDDLLGEVRAELSVEKIFDKEYWGNDGVWLWDVPEEMGGTVVFDDVVGAHPLVSKWERIAETEMKRWGVDGDIWDGEAQDDEVMDAKANTRQSKPQRGVATEAAPAGAGSIMGVERGKLSW